MDECGYMGFPKGGEEEEEEEGGVSIVCVCLEATGSDIKQCKQPFGSL